MEYGRFYQWKPWKYGENWRFSTYICEFAKGLSLSFKEKGKDYDDPITMKVTFPGWEVRFRVSDDLYQGPFIFWCNNNPSEFRGTQETLGSPIYIVEGSDYLKDYKIETGGMFDPLDRPLKHYYISDTDYVIDVISESQPRIEIYKDSELVECVETIHHSKLYNLDGTPKST
jgi:hypothetical protein